MAGSDLRYAWRALARSPVFSVTAVLSLALGIAASTAIFSLADAILLRPRVGVANPATVVEIGRSVNGEGFDNFGYPLFTALRDRNTTLAGIAACELGPQVMSLGGANAAERVFANLVSWNYFELLGTHLALGRFFLPEEDRTAGTHPVVVLKHQFWRDRFAGDRAVVGSSITLNGLAYTVVGVAEEGFTGTSLISTDFWVPMAMVGHVRGERGRSSLTDERAVWHIALGRLKPGISVRQARDELDAIAKNYLRERGDERAARWGIDVAPSARVPAPARMIAIGFIAMLGGLTTLVLVIACSNVAGMLLARALLRRREIATRLAIGGSRRRIVGQLLTEGLLLAALAAAVSLPVTNALVTLLEAFQPNVPLPLALELRVDLRVMLYATALAMGTALLFALVPALQSTRFDLAPVLHGATATADRRRAWLRQGLVAAQVSMALLLLVATGLFLRSLQQAASIDEGFNVNNVDTLQVDMELAGYGRADAVRAVEELMQRFRAIDGVSAVAASRMVPLQGGGLGLGRLRAPGYADAEGRDEVSADWDVVTPDYFRTLELPIVRGRGFDARDREGASYAAVVNETLASRVWPGRDPIGQQLLQDTGEPGLPARALIVVGVARDAKYRSLAEAPRNFIYVPHAQQYLPDITFYLRRTSAGSRIAAARDMIRAFNPALPVIYAQSLERATAIGLLPQKLAAWVAGTVGVVGLLLAAIGLYGLMSFVVAQRTREIAVRMALGATRESVLRLVLRQSGRLAAFGAAVGLALSFAAGMALRSLLIGIQPIDPVAFASSVLVLTFVLLLASWTPARRAAAMDPMRALRAE